ncbi:unnamed protein product, partial [Prorocentrum cordatum]
SSMPCERWPCTGRWTRSPCATCAPGRTRSARWCWTGSGWSSPCTTWAACRARTGASQWPTT